MKKYTEHILNKCPVCGSKLLYNAYHQYSNIYSIKRNGEVSDTRIRKVDNGPLEAGFIHCSNDECDFMTDTELLCASHRNIYVFQDGAAYKYIDTDEEVTQC